MIGNREGLARHSPGTQFFVLGLLFLPSYSPARAQIPSSADPSRSSRPAWLVESDGEYRSSRVEAFTPPRTPDGIRDPNDTRMRADNAWGLVCSALLLMMIAPGLALFHGGQVRRKNVLSVMMQVVFLVALMTVVWALWGYSLAFGGDAAHGWARWVGSTEFLGMSGVGSSWDPELERVVTPMNGSVPRLTHLLYQGMFFIIAPVLMCGAYAERMRFGAVVLLSILWGTFVYCPLCHWVWGKGPLAFGVEGALVGGVLDYAGGAVVHVSAGISALVCALFVGKRLGFHLEPMPPHNLTYTTLGAAMLWVGWFGFNGGRSLSADAMVAQALVATHLSASAGALTWACLEWVLRKRPSVLGTSSGAISGLVCVSSAAGFIHPLSALVMGTLAGMASFFACTKLRRLLGYDDSLDVFGIHGVGGMLGVLLTGVLASRGSLDVNQGQPVGLIDGDPHLLLGHVAGLALITVFTVITTFIILKIVDAAIGLRVLQEHEVEGLDVTEHGEEGYIYL